MTVFRTRHATRAVEDFNGSAVTLPKDTHLRVVEYDEHDVFVSANDAQDTVYLIRLEYLELVRKLK